MKRILIAAIILISTISIQAKDILPENVPAKVREYVSKNYSKVNYVEWEDKSSKGYYEAEFTYEGKDVELNIANNGTLISSEEDILIKDIPSFATKYVEKNYNKAEILRGSKKTKNNYTTYYVKIKYDNAQGYERTRGLVFDSKGNLIKR